MKMSVEITIELSKELREQIVTFAADDGTDPEEWVRGVLGAHVFVRAFRSVRAEMLRDLDARGIYLADQDVLGTDR